MSFHSGSSYVNGQIWIVIWCQWLRFNAPRYSQIFIFTSCYPTNYRLQQLSFLDTKIFFITFNVNHFVFWNVNKMHNCYLLISTYLFYKSNCSGFEICMHSRRDSARKMKRVWWEAWRKEWVFILRIENYDRLDLWPVMRNLLNNSQIFFYDLSSLIYVRWNVYLHFTLFIGENEDLKGK